MQRTLTISLSSATVQALSTGNLALYGFAAVSYGPVLTAAVGYGGGYPLVWFRIPHCLQSTVVTLSDPAAAFISTTALSGNAVVAMSASAPADVGQTVQVATTGLLTTEASGQPGVISVVNQGPSPWTCGLSADAGPGPAPICAFPLHGNSMDMIGPTAKVLVMFAIDKIPVGSAVSTAYAEGLFIDFQTETARAVSFDIDQGWSWGNGTWAAVVPPQTDLGALLITP
ncbi:MAG: hypothetical protein PSV23_16350 [Brevundimonas sp.]|uniref:hypothetical protein n=1 Tax=Brevundimonas sp. TaxID=1871086 RepID=UPI0024879DE7|nr:hypothetical protein [Brevundimonas sp.]MDI1328362.1 hypothetical protein [Brevundimonas sp.]